MKIESYRNGNLLKQHHKANLHIDFLPEGICFSFALDNKVLKLILDTEDFDLLSTKFLLPTIIKKQKRKAAKKTKTGGKQK